MEGLQAKKDVQDRRLSLIDVSSADDSLIDTLSENPVLVKHQCSENHEHVDLLGSAKSQPNGTSEAEKAKGNTKYNLRKSLAWDSAFFTSAGVLDPDELSCIIEGVEKEEKHALTAIQEDLHNSCESFSTLESDKLTLDSLEADLFEDIRASIQKSSKKSNVANLNSTVPSRAAGFLAVDSLKKTVVASQDKLIEALPASKNPSSSMPGSGKMTKKTQGSLQLSQKPAATRGEPSNLRQPKVLGKSCLTSTISAKRASVGDLQVKCEKKAKQVVGGIVTSVSKAPVSSGSQVIVPKPALSSKSTSSPSVATKTKSGTSTSSLNTLKKKVGAGIVKPPSSGSAVRTPLRVSSRDKTESGNPSLSASLTSVTRLSSSISPASSISDWSSDSSSSTYSKQRSNSSRTSVDSISSKRAASDTDTLQASHSENLASDSSSKGHETQVSGFVNQCARVTSTGMVLPPAHAKPSALRLPSPKIGFFDGVKSSVRTPQGGTPSHSAVPCGSPKFRAGIVSPSESKNNTKFGKRQPVRSIMSIENPKPDHHQISKAHTRVSSSSEISIEIKNKMLLSNGADNLKADNIMNEGVQNKLHLTTGAGKLKADNVMAEGLLVGSTYTNGALETSVDKLASEINFENKFSSQTVGEEGSVSGQFNLPKAEDAPLLRHDNGMNNSHMHCKYIFESLIHSPEGINGLHSKNCRAPPTDAACNNRSPSASYIAENKSSSNVVGKAPVDTVDCQHDLLNDLHQIKCINDQKTSHYDDQVDSLSRQIDALDINTAIQKRIDGDS